jgi:hypothetical protein
MGALLLLSLPRVSVLPLLIDLLFSPLLVVLAHSGKSVLGLYFFLAGFFPLGRLSESESEP